MTDKWGVIKKNDITGETLVVLPDGEEFPMLKSAPPSGKCKITNLYVDPVTGKVVIQYDDTPNP